MCNLHNFDKLGKQWNRGNWLNNPPPLVPWFLAFLFWYFISKKCTNIRINNTYRQITHWGRVTHICVGNLTIIGSDNGLSPGRRQAITWTNVGILLIGPLGTNFSEILIVIHTFSFKKIQLKMSSGKWRPFLLSLNEIRSFICIQTYMYHLEAARETTASFPCHHNP